MPWHLELDALSEAEKAKEGTAIGTTKKGIGPTYMDKSERSGIRMHDFVDAERSRRLSARPVPVRTA